jgi:hypothetical protein
VNVCSAQGDGVPERDCTATSIAFPHERLAASDVIDTSMPDWQHQTSDNHHPNATKLEDDGRSIGESSREVHTQPCDPRCHARTPCRVVEWSRSAVMRMALLPPIGLPVLQPALVWMPTRKPSDRTSGLPQD